MDWLNLGTALARIGAPVLGSVFLGPAGGAAAGALVNVITDKLGTALGVPATPEAITTAINADPTAAAAKVAPVEADHQDAIRAYLADVADARSTNVQLVQAGSSIAYGPVIISIIITAGFFGLLTLLLFVHLDDTSTRVSAIINVILGTLAAAFTQVCNYWLGSTSNSKARMDQLATIAQSAVTAPKVPARR